MQNDEGLESILDLDYSVDGFIFFISFISLSFILSISFILFPIFFLLFYMEASSYLYDKSFEILYDFSKEKLNRFFSFDEKEFFTSVCIIGEKSEKLKNSFNLALPTIDGSSYEEGRISFFEPNEFIEKAYKDSLNIKDKKENINEKFC